MMSEKDTERFMSNVTPEPNSGCWLWTGNVNKHGYGRFGFSKTVKLAHRVSCEHFKNENIAGKVVCHKCDVPACVNPDHIFAATHAENSRDMVFKSRQSKGSDRPFAKLTEDAVLHIREKSLSQRDYSRLYGVSQSKISMVQNRKTWRHLGQ